MTAATMPDTTLKFPPGPAPALPDTPPPADELNPTPGPTLAGAVVGDVPTKATAAAPEEPEAPPMTPDQIIGVVAELSAFGLPAGLAEAYKDDFKHNQLVALGVQFSGLADALAAYGVTGAGGKMPEWLSVALGVAVLGYGVYSTRSKYVESLPTPAPEAATGAAGGFAGAGFGPSLSSADLGFSGAGEGGRGE
ncbi:hypothetical protein [Deinococcus sp. KSM4-11]|uniref:hypothetical protein n=1 Tax=Deinococcus sp. KSM4-11 TaxID=2568654 RepID=UPI001454E41B|nr:hypothetical protein [Deinococcus sp. KSM4-11]